MAEACSALGSSRAAINGDGSLIAFVRPGSDTAELTLVDRRSRRETMLRPGGTPCPIGDGPAWIGDVALSANGAILAFVHAVPERSADDGGLSLKAYSDLYVYELRRRRLLRLGADGALDAIAGTGPQSLEVAVSGTGDQIGFAAASASGPPGETNIFLYDRAGPGLIQVNGPANGAGRAIAMSADGGTLFFCNTADGGLFVHERALGRTTALPITTLPRNVGAGRPYAIAGDGRLIAFETDSGERHVRLYDRATGLIEEVSETLGLFCRHAEQPTISRDGRYVAFSSRLPGLRASADLWRIYVFDRATRRVRLIDGNDDAAAPRRASISADGSTLLTEITRAGGTPAIAIRANPLCSRMEPTHSASFRISSAAAPSASARPFQPALTAA